VEDEMKLRGVLRFSILLLVFLNCKTFSRAQNKSVDAAISGTIVDATGGAIGGVVVTVTSEETRGVGASATSKADGSYTLAVPAGRYRLRFVRAPFSPAEAVVDVGAGESRISGARLTLERLSSSVVVTAQAEPSLLEQATAPVSIISREEIEARQAVSVTDALLFAPGIAIGRTGAEGGSTSVFLNGGNSNFTKVLIDGAPINPPGGAVDFSSLTLDNIDKVEIVRGAESAIYGTDAVSGVIQLFTHRGERRVPEVNIFAEGGSFSTARGGAEVGGLVGKFDYSAASSYLESGGQGLNDSFINRTVSGNFGYRFSETNQLRLTLRNNTSNAGIPGQTIFTPPSLHQRYDQRIFSANARWDFSTGTHWHHEIGGGEMYTRQHNDNPIQSFFSTDPNLLCPQANPASVPTAEFCDSTNDSRIQYNRANVSAQSSYVRSNFGATAGYEYEVENAFLSSLGVHHARRNNQGGFLDFRWRPIRRVSLNFGGRAEANANFGTRVVPRMGVSMVARFGSGMIGDTLVRAFFGQGIKEPRFDQTLGDNFGDLGNPSLKPESSKNWSAGIEQKLWNDRVRLTADYFYNSFYNIVSFAFCLPDPSNPAGNSCGLAIPEVPATGFGFFFNTDRALGRGIKVAGESKFTRWLNLAGNYTYDDTRVLQAPNAFDPSELPGNHLIRRSVNSGSLTLNAQWRRVGFNVGGYFTGVRTDSDFLGLGLSRNPGYARFDLAGHYHLGHGVLLYARAQNLFDKQYEDVIGYPALGRDARVGVRYMFKGRD
jgi:vitamin B12 transporter